MNKFKNITGKLGRPSWGWARSMTTKTFNTIDNLRERSQSALNRIDGVLKSQAPDRIGELLANAEEMYPQVKSRGLSQKYETALDTARRATQKSQRALNKLDAFMESDGLREFRQMTGTGYGKYPNSKGPARLPRLPPMEKPRNARLLRFQSQMAGAGPVVQTLGSVNVPYNQHGLSLRSL